MFSHQKSKPWAGLMGFGLISLCSFGLVFFHQGVLLEYSTQGGMLSILPVIIVLYFSLIHGIFADRLLSSLGLKAAARTKLQA